MIRLGDHEPRLGELASQLAQRLTNRRETARLVARGPAGAGRRRLLEELAAHPGVVAIEPPGLAHLDAALSALVQAASHLPGSHALIADHRDETGEVDRDMARRAELVGRALADHGKAVALLVPRSWSDPDGGANSAADGAADDGALAALGRARALLAGLRAAPRLSILLLGDPPGGLAHGETAVELPPIRIAAEDLDLDALPDALRPAGERLAGHLGATRAEIAPDELRLRLGLVALGCAPERLCDLRLVALARRLARRLSRAQAAGLGRLLLARRPLERAAGERLVGLGDGASAAEGPSGADLALLTACAAYGGDRLWIGEGARAALLEQLHDLGVGLSPPELAAAHRFLAEHHRAAADAPRIDGLPPAGAAAWLERLHHLAHGGDLTADAWRAHRCFARELLWARARCLGEARDHAGAAALYRDSLGAFGDHPYAHHGFALHLDAGGDNPELIERHYREAVTFEPERPRWSARLVTFLIEIGAHDKARREWRDAAERVERAAPAGGLAWAALGLHEPVARRWLARGHLAEARAVLDDVPPHVLRLAQPLADLARELAEAEAAAPVGAPAPR